MSSGVPVVPHTEPFINIIETMTPVKDWTYESNQKIADTEGFLAVSSRPLLGQLAIILRLKLSQLNE